MKNGIKNPLTLLLQIISRINKVQKQSFYIFIAFLMFDTPTFAQLNTPIGVFITDSADIGRPIYFSLSVRHHPSVEIFFPDSLSNFMPFEFVNKQIFTSKTSSKITLDSAIYQLISFSIAPIQYLSLPIYVFNKKDCTSLFSQNDTLFLKASNLIIIKNQKEFVHASELLSLNDEFNFSVLLAILVFTIGLGAVIFWLFGEDIYKQWQLLKLQRRHIEYLRAFNRLLRNTRDKGSIKDAEKAIIIWKNYLEKLERRPFATFTTREIIDSMPDPALAEALRNLDGMIYGQVKSSKMQGFLEVLKEGGTKMYRNRRRQILDHQKV